MDERSRPAALFAIFAFSLSPSAPISSLPISFRGRSQYRSWCKRPGCRSENRETELSCRRDAGKWDTPSRVNECVCNEEGRPLNELTVHAPVALSCVAGLLPVVLSFASYIHTSSIQLATNLSRGGVRVGLARHLCPRCLSLGIAS